MSNYFFCYDKSLMKHLNLNGNKYITRAINPNTMKMFWLFEINDKLKNSIDNHNGK